MVRNARHRNTLAFLCPSGGEHQVQLARGDLSIIIKGLVKIAQAKKNNRTRIFLFDIQVLLSDWGNFISHVQTRCCLGGASSEIASAQD
jgi:hypothetical protein